MLGRIGRMKFLEAFDHIDPMRLQWVLGAAEALIQVAVLDEPFLGQGKGCDVPAAVSVGVEPPKVSVDAAQLGAGRHDLADPADLGRPFPGSAAQKNLKLATLFLGVAVGVPLGFDLKR